MMTGEDNVVPFPASEPDWLPDHEPCRSLFLHVSDQVAKTVEREEAHRQRLAAIVAAIDDAIAHRPAQRTPHDHSHPKSTG